MAYQQFVNYEWAKGLAGTGEIDFGSGYTPFEAWGPEVAEGWQKPDIATWVFQIRKGIHYALDPNNEASKLMNGRELTADDVVWNVWRLHFDPRFPRSAARSAVANVVKGLSVEKTGSWEVTVKTIEEPWVAFFWVIWGGCSQMMYAREVVDKYGNADDWRRTVGTGPFIWTDYVSQSVATFARNPNYWGRDVAGPGKGNQIPYVDTVKQLVVPDLSTRLAAMRTGKADWVTAIQSEDARSLFQTNPRLQSVKIIGAGSGFRLRFDKQDLPFKDKRVRHALMMATDFDSLRNDLYRGDAEVDIWPVPSNWPNLHISMKDLPESVQALYKYNPDKAKQLLVDAGYPKGFKTKAIVQNTTTDIDAASAFKAMWAKVGIEIELQPREYVVWNNFVWNFVGVEEMLFSTLSNTGATSIYSLYSWLRHPDLYGWGRTWSDQIIEDAFQQMQKYMFVNFPKVDEIYRKTVPYLMEQAFIIPSPTPYTYTIWQPWIKNHYGETSYRQWLPYAWVDQDLKEKMTGRR